MAPLRRRRGAAAGGRLNRARCSLLLIALAALGCGGTDGASRGAVAVLDVQVRNVDGLRTLQEVALLVDGREVARFAQQQAEPAIVFGKRVDGLAPGMHDVEVRIVRQTEAKGLYAAGGAVGYQGHRLRLDETQAELATGELLRMRIELAVPTPTPAPSP